MNVWRRQGFLRYSRKAIQIHSEAFPEHLRITKSSEKFRSLRLRCGDHGPGDNLTRCRDFLFYQKVLSIVARAVGRHDFGLPGVSRFRKSAAITNPAAANFVI